MSSSQKPKQKGQQAAPGVKGVSARTPSERQEVKRLIALMRDPRYWRDQDPELQRLVRDGFTRLYGRPSFARPVALGRQAQSAA